MDWSFLTWAVGPFIILDLMWKVWGWIRWKPDPALAGMPRKVVRDRRATRHPLRAWSTWGEIVALLLFGLAPELMAMHVVRSEPPATYQDNRQALLDIRSECPALAKDATALLARGVPSGRTIDGLRARQEVISANPVRGQVCAQWDGLHPFAKTAKGSPL